MREKSASSQIVSSVNQKVGLAIHKYRMIQESDRILVGLSGGKDSMVLLSILAGRLKFQKVKFELTAIHISLTSQSYLVDLEYLELFCRQLDVPLIHKMIEQNLPEKVGQNPCYECARRRRISLFETANQLGFNKLALGHHMDDAVETLLMNMVFQSSISSMPPILSLFNGNLSIIRPLILLTESEVKEYSGELKLHDEIKRCKFEKDSKRNEMKKIVGQLQELQANVRTNIYASMTNIQTEYLPGEKY